MNKVSKVIVVTINYDDINELKRTIESVESQKIKPKKQIIISKKLRFSQIKKLKKKYMQFILGKDTSLYNAMNIGKKNSFDSPVIFLNSGDVFYNRNSMSLIQKYHKYLQKNNVLLFKTVLVNGKDYFYPKKKYFQNKNYLPHSSFIFYNSRLYKNINFDEKMIISADGKWMREIIQKSTRLIKVRRNLVLQNLDGQSSLPRFGTIYSRFNENAFSGLKEIVKLLLRFFLSKKFYFRLIYFYKYNL